MSTFTEIYVDLSRPDSTGYPVDSNGVVICDSSTGIGTRSNPISLREFREYLYYDHGISQMFLLSGTASFDLNGSSDVGSLGINTLFETPHSGKSLKLFNWTSDTLEVNTPWHITVLNSSNNDNVKISTNKDNFELNNGEIQLSGTAARFTFGEEYSNSLESLELAENTNNTLVLSNMKMYSKYQIDSIANFMNAYKFLNYKKLLLINTLINNKTTSASVFVSNATVLQCEVAFVNTIFSRINELIGYPYNRSWNTLYGNSLDSVKKDMIVNIDNCVFSEPLISLTNKTPNSGILSYFPIMRNLVVKAGGKNQYDWPVASACNVDLSTLKQLDNFNYVGEWVSISAVSGVQENVYINGLGGYGAIRNRFTYRKDGVGPLTYVEIPDFSVSSSNSYIKIGDTVAFSNKDIIYDSTYVHGPYYWNFGDGVVSATTSGNIEYTYTTPIDDNVHVSLYSYNSWYSKKASVFQNVGLSGIDYTLAVYVTSSDGFDEFLVPTTSANIFDLIVLSAVNTSVGTDDYSVYNSWGYDFSESVTNTPISKNIARGPFKKIDGYQTATHRYVSSGMYDVYYSAIDMNYDTNTKYETLNIYDHTQSTYYVDLDVEYEDEQWLDMPTGITDDFELGYLDPAWGVAFKGNYNVKTMWDNQIAYGDGSQIMLLDKPFHYEFKCQFSFVRDERESMPSMLIKSVDNDVFNIEWDYDNERILFYYYDESPIIIRYDLKKFGYVKDLRCSNSLRELKIRIEHSRENNDFYFAYSIDGITWINSGISNFINVEDKRLFMYATTNGNTGLGYITIKSKYGLPYDLGSEKYPLTYSQFKARVEINGTGEYNDKYLCRNYRKIFEIIQTNPNKYFEIGAWNLSIYGPWMIVVDVNVSSPFNSNYDVSFQGTRLSNGIIYNTVESSNRLKYAINLRLSFAYDMFIVWQGYQLSKDQGVVRLVKSKWMNRLFKYTDIVGSTINSKNGIIEIR